ncbi:hypothetical protein PF005_g22514 [Phytophthora fragariae]|nr:hypothetical protein PF011_g21247 [Phytophthora fragariae]KAE8984734.1 hypothetical protein PR001_g23087 [Phytophthora rubi]KAE8992008.1 hypothetical protein PR002_g20685 [Phytophthora rubi]KAE9074207.1 hypothetical protein PF010_g24770 [Phytophthora fragariae]KAE9093618.1 hypothetical protein PF006_g24396 [Phytophthora fragariae]
MFSTIIPTPCTATTPCGEESGAEGNSSLYQFCSYTQEDYLNYAYKDTVYVLLEHYDDADCETLTSTDVYRADGKCHNSLNYALQVVVNTNGSVNVQSRTKTCDLGDWEDVFEPAPKANVNTGVCFPMEMHSAKLYLVDGTNDTSSSSSSGSGSATNAATIELSSSTPALFATPLALGLAMLVLASVVAV